MGLFKGRFSKVVRSYSVEEKVVSLLLCILVFTLTVLQIKDWITLGFDFVTAEGTYTEALVAENGVILNPLFSSYSEANRDINSLIFSGLLRYDPPSKSFVADLADLKIGEDLKTYTFTLKDNLKWHDEVPLTSDDVFFTYHEIIQNRVFENSLLKATFDGVKIIQIDAKTIQFVLTKPNSFFVGNFSTGILPKHIFAKEDLSKLSSSNVNLHPIGAGPYAVDSEIRDINDFEKQLTLVVNKNYYSRLPNIKAIKFNIYTDTASMLKDVNKVNVIAKVNTEALQDLKKNKSFTLNTYTLPQYTAVFFNTDAPLIARVKMRLALVESINRADLQKLFPDKAGVATPFLDSKYDTEVVALNLEQANGALYDLGYKLDTTDGLRKNKKGEALQVTLLVRKYEDGMPRAIEQEKLVKFLTDSWKVIGVKLNVEALGMQEYSEKVAARSYDMVLAGQSLGYDLDMYSFWHSSQATNFGLNLSNYKTFAVDTLIEKIRSSSDETARNGFLAELNKQMAQDLPALFLYRPYYYFATDNTVKNISLVNLAFISDRFAMVSDWCILNCDK